jgi:hypothetical protein
MIATSRPVSSAGLWGDVRGCASWSGQRDPIRPEMAQDAQNKGSLTRRPLVIEASHWYTDYLLDLPASKEG